jgi:predicted transcriptional regulator
MKVFTFKYQRNPKRSVLTAMKRAIRTGVADVRNDELICDSMSSMLKLMSKSRFEVFAAIVEHKPGSLNELARVMDKDPGNVLRDVKSLESLGLIRLIPLKGDRERLKPESLFDKIIFEFEPKVVRTG